ncbi:AraC family transcriptional regulator [Pseudoruegeria sp. HB172150]|uniref:AraC family transcriptional regulator n=1 Tax=Pseudoruegeria sp. HB172150 TaxID=2721164 RepID=UPI0015564773|nr:AraC family transcriptional regulator [Pseudoruegeria sp. HB172150]
MMGDMDVLTELLRIGRVGQTLMGHPTMYGDWGVRVSPSMAMVLHSSRKGSCWYHQDAAGPPLRLGEGDVILATSGAAHGISDAPRRELREMDDVLEVMKLRAASAQADKLPQVTMLCAKFEVDMPRQTRLFAALPELIHLTGAQVAGDSRLSAALELFSEEAKQGGDGTEIAKSRLLDTVLIYVIRRWFELSGPAAPGWFRAMKEPGIAAALSAIHTDPGRGWTVDALADIACLSRATFLRRFREATGEAPMAYLQQWRMALAAKVLAEGRDGLAVVADRFGYDSAASFSKAFRRTIGMSPAEYRNSRRAVEPDAAELSVSPG